MRGDQSEGRVRVTTSRPGHGNTPVCLSVGKVRVAGGWPWRPIPLPWALRSPRVTINFFELQRRRRTDSERFQPSTYQAMDPSMLEGMDEETRQSFELAWKLQAEEDAREAEQAAAAARIQHEPEDTESMALAIRLQQEDDEQALRNALGVLGGDADSDDPGSPSQYSYEQLMNLQQTVGEVSRGASFQAIDALRTMSYEEACKDADVILGDQVRARASLVRTPASGAHHSLPASPLSLCARLHVSCAPPCSSAPSAASSTRRVTRCACCAAATRSTPSASTNGSLSTRAAHCAKRRSSRRLLLHVHRARRRPCARSTTAPARCR